MTSGTDCTIRVVSLRGAVEPSLNIPIAVLSAGGVSVALVRTWIRARPADGSVQFDVAMAAVAVVVLTIIGAFLYRLCGTEEITLTANELNLVARLGVLRWSRWIRLDAIRSIDVQEKRVGRMRRTAYTIRFGLRGGAMESSVYLDAKGVYGLVALLRERVRHATNGPMPPIPG